MDKEKQQQVASDFIKSLPEPSEGMKRIAKADAEYIRGRLGFPPKDARYVLVRFLKPFIQAKWFGIGGREVGVAYFRDLEEKWTVALYDIPTIVDPGGVLLLRFEPLQDGPAFAAGRCFTWTVGIEDVASCQVLSTQVMEVFKASDPFTSKRIVGFSKLEPQEPLPPSVGEVAAKVLGEALAPVPEYQTDVWGDALAAQKSEFDNEEDRQLVQGLADAVDGYGLGIVHKTRSPMTPLPKDQLHVYNQTPFPALDDVTGTKEGELSVLGGPPRSSRPLGPVLPELSERGREAFRRVTLGEKLHQDLAQARAEEDQSVFAAISQSENMLKCGSRECAEAEAKERGQLYGHSVLSGGWYVGTATQLMKIGVVDIAGYPSFDACVREAIAACWGVTKTKLRNVVVAQDETQELTEGMKKVFLDGLSLLAMEETTKQEYPSLASCIEAEMKAADEAGPLPEFTVVTDTPSLTNQVMHGMRSKDEEVTLFGGAAQVMTNTSTLPTISKEELALLEAADLLCEAEEYDVEGNRVRNYEAAKANFMATRKEF